MQPRNVDVRNDATYHDQHVVEPLFLQQLHQARADVHVRARQDREADHVGILLQRRRDDLLRRLTEAGVNHFHSCVAERARDDLGAPVVAVKTRLGDDDANLFHQ